MLQPPEGSRGTMVAGSTPSEQEQVGSSEGLFLDQQKIHFLNIDIHAQAHKSFAATLAR